MTKVAYDCVCVCVCVCVCNGEHGAGGAGVQLCAEPCPHLPCIPNNRPRWKKNFLSFLSFLSYSCECITRTSPSIPPRHLALPFCVPPKRVVPSLLSLPLSHTCARRSSTSRRRTGRPRRTAVRSSAFSDAGRGMPPVRPPRRLSRWCPPRAGWCYSRAVTSPMPCCHSGRAGRDSHSLAG